MSQKTSKRATTLSGIFLQGLAITLPITLTLAVFFWLATTTENFLGGLIQLVFPYSRYWSGMGIMLAIAIIFLAGILMNILITRRFLVRIDRLLDRIPLIKSIYGSMRDIAFFFSKRDSGKGFQQVVAVSLTNRIRLIGFVTITNVDGTALDSGASDSIVGVYLPMSYQIGGYTVYLPSSLIEPLDMTVEDAMRLTLTAGMSGKRSRAS
jgi:uncharacterized membrane protein